MVERGQHLSLALEPLQSLAIHGERCGKDLERDLAREPRVARAPDLSHRSRTELCDDLVRTESCSWRQRHPRILGDTPLFLPKSSTATLRTAGSAPAPEARRGAPTGSRVELAGEGFQSGQRPRDRVNRRDVSIAHGRQRDEAEVLKATGTAASPTPRRRRRPERTRQEARTRTPTPRRARGRRRRPLELGGR